MASVSPIMHISGEQRTLVTPEGVDLRLKLATAGQRAGAFLIDFLLLIAILVIFTIILAFAGIGTVGSTGTDGVEVISILWLLGFFLLRNFYFIAFEVGRRSATLGKRWLGRVVGGERDGL